MSIIYDDPYLFALPFLLLIVGIGLSLLWMAENPPARGLLQNSCRRGGAVFEFAALLFGLFAAFLANDVSTHADRARASVAREAGARAVVLSIADGGR